MSRRKGQPVFTPGANPERAKAMHGLRSSSAAGTHGDRRTKRNRSRNAQRRNAIRDAY